MGRSKSNLKTPGGVTLLDRACTLGAALLSTLKQDQREVYVSGDYPGYRCIPDLTPQCGPLGGIYAAVDRFLKHRSLQYLLILPVDMPALSVPLLLCLLQDKTESTAVHFDGYELPLLLKISEEVEKCLKIMLNNSELKGSSRSVRGFLDDISAISCKTPQNATSEFINLNTPNDFSGWISGVS